MARHKPIVLSDGTKIPVRSGGPMNPDLGVADGLTVVPGGTPFVELARRRAEARVRGATHWLDTWAPTCRDTARIEAQLAALGAAQEELRLYEREVAQLKETP